MASDQSSPKLPAGWERILDEIHGRLSEALREAETPVAEGSGEVVAGQDFEALCARLDQLQTSADQAEALVRQADLALEAAQVALQGQVEASAGLRQRLA